MKVIESSPILSELKSFRETGSVLYIAAHPDDENTELLAYLARGLHYRTAYMSLTRGDGGQNVLGADFGAKLGVARTQELLAARKIDGAQQFFSRAIDFGFSKSYKETLGVWDHDEVLSDIVRVIREFHPDILITRFSPIPGGTHGHHTASARLALEAFKLAGDPKAFPEQNLPPWQPERIFWNMSIFQKDKADQVTEPFHLNISGSDRGEAFTSIAVKSRGMHKTQGFDNWKIQGDVNGTREERFQLLAGDKPSHVLFNTDTTWLRIPGGANVDSLIGEIIDNFRGSDAAASVPALLKLRTALNKLNADDPVLKEKRALLDRIICDCLQLKTVTTIPRYDIVPGEQMKLQHTASIGTDVAVKWIEVRYPSIGRSLKKDIRLNKTTPSTWDSTETLPPSTPVTQPWWLQAEGSPGMFHANDPNLIGTAENAPAFPIENIFEVDGQTIVVPDEPVQLKTNADGKEVRRRLDVIPPVSMRFTDEVSLFAPSGSNTVSVELDAARENISGSLHLQVPPEWKVAPAEQPFNLAKVGEKAELKFTLTAPAKDATANIVARADVHGHIYSTQHEEIDYPHIPPQILQPPAMLKVVSLDLKKRGHLIGFLPGAGDSSPEVLKRMGYEVKILDDNLTAETLQGLDAVVIGVRAFNVRKEIAKAVPTLFEYVKNGGVVITQYNLGDGLKSDKIAPYDVHISRDRVTDEKAAMTFLAPDSPVLNTPNKITLADFEGWVQERGLYFPNSWDDHFTPIFACNDPDDAPMKGALLVAPYGKGYYIYTGLSFFRQLPAGVPGAYRLFANLLSIGHDDKQ